MNLWMLLSIALWLFGGIVTAIAMTECEEWPDAKQWVYIALWPVAVALLLVGLPIAAVIVTAKRRMQKRTDHP
jgi:membrane protein DedA with SNARE-associated domain